MPRFPALVVSTVLALGATVAPAQTWPARPVHVVVPAPAGSSLDIIARTLGERLKDRWGQPVVVDNRPGAGGLLGMDAVAKAPADGHTLVAVANSFCANQTLVKALPYDAARDLRPVGLMGLSEHVLATHPGSGLRTLADLTAAAKKAPGKLSYASFGNGTSAHLSGAMLEAQLGVDLIHVPYKGQAPALNDLLGGQVSVMFGNWPEFRNHVKSGKLLALGMATAKRSVHAPDVPTLAEQGLALESNSWNGVLTRAGTPDAVVAKLNAAINQALAAPAVVQAFRDGGIVSLAGSPAQFAAFIRSETDKYATVIRKAGITADS